MNRKYAVYNQDAECQDCYKCLRVCPVKAIPVKEGHACIDPEHCIACGRCVAVCPVNAKKIRDDTPRAGFLIKNNSKVYACLAPSWQAEFPSFSKEDMGRALGKLGFCGIIEAAAGAEIVSQWTAEFLSRAENDVFFSSACPVCNEYIRRFYPHYSKNITPVVSPAIAAAKQLRSLENDGIKIVFVGPCIAKKNEAENSGGAINMAITFVELRRWLAEMEEDENISENCRFITEATGGSLYPLERGMIRTIQEGLSSNAAEMISISGLERLDNILKRLPGQQNGKPVLVECLACEGGCIGGPGMEKGCAGLAETLRINAISAGMKISAFDIELVQHYENIGEASSGNSFSEVEICKAMHLVGKEKPEDELNCGGCGYDTCRDFASALLNGRAEVDMCVSYMRRQAQRKANALLRCMPSGVVIVNAELQVIECNESFAAMFGEDTENAFKIYPGLTGADLESIVPLSRFFRRALQTGDEIIKEHLPIDGRLFNINIFVIEPGRTAGAVMQDVTNQEIKREQIALQAKEVIRKNITTVQEIACLLGEHVTETEILLSNIAEGYSKDRLEKVDDTG